MLAWPAKHSNTKSKTAIIALLTLLSCQSANAADVPSSFPNILDPGLVQKRLSTPVLAPAPVAPALGIKPPAGQAQIPNAAAIKFKLNQVTFEGNSVFSSAQLAALFNSKMGTEISLADLENLVQAVTNQYRNAGYILTRAILPPQTIKGGLVHIQVIEGFISHVTVAGKPGSAQALLQTYADKITQSRPLQMKVLERYLLLANDIPGTNVKAVLVPSSTTSGSADLTLVADQKIADGYISYDNYGTKFIGPNEATIGGDINSIFRAGDSTAAQVAVTSQTNELNFLELTHSEYLGSNGTRLLVGASYTRTNPGFLLEPVDIVGQSRALLADLSYPILRSRTENFFVHTQANYQNINTTIASGQPFYDDHIRSLDFGTHYDFADGWHGVNSSALDMEQGFDILGANEGGDRSRPLGRSDYTKFTLNLSRLQSLSSRFSAYVAVLGEYAPTPLLASEQFTFGGPTFGRGYDPSELTGDRGVEGSAELRMDTNPDVILFRTVQYYIFYDAGQAWNINAAASGLPASYSAVSTGIGARMTFSKNLSGNFFLAKPLTKPVANLLAAQENGNGIRGFFQITANI